MSLALRYRADIDGLRAFAVLPVVLFHAGIPGFSGGYVGVDVVPRQHLLDRMA